MKDLDRFPLRTLLMSLAGALILPMAIATVTEAASPREFVNGHLQEVRAHVRQGINLIGKTLDAGKILKTASREANSAPKKLSDAETRLNQTAERIRTVQEKRQEMSKTVSSLPSGTPGRDRLLRDLEEMRKQVESLSKSVEQAKALLTDIKPKITIVRQNLNDASAVFQKNKGTLKKSRGALMKADSVVTKMKTAAKWLPDAPDIKKLD